MADKKISELTAVTASALTDEFEVNQAGASKKATLAQVAATILLSAYKGSDQATISSTSFIDVTSLGIAIEASKAYEFYWGLVCDATATSEAIRLAVNGPASPTDLVYNLLRWTTASSNSVVGGTTYDEDQGETGSQGAVKKLFELYGVIRNGANAGTIIPRIRAEIGTPQTVAVRAGSFGYARLLN